MDIDINRAKELITRPSESLSVELKRWIDPDAPEGMAKIVRAVLALRNHGGGYLVIGFDNKTFKSDQENFPGDVKSKFHIDKIQGLITRFASEPFEIGIAFPELEGRVYPVIAVPADVKTPVAARSDLKVEENKLINAGDVYVRSLRSNNTPSTAKAGWQDWPKLVETCFDNREADIGRFMRRHLSSLTPDMLLEFVSIITKIKQPKETTEDMLQRVLSESEKRFIALVIERKIKLPEHGSWEAALIINGDVPSHSANREFLNLLDSSNPNYTGWPVWLDSRGFSNQAHRPYVINGIWEAFIVSVQKAWSGDHIDFMRLDPKGRFYIRRALQDDMGEGKPKPLTELDFGLVILRTAETIAVGMAFAKAMGCEPEKTILNFAFRWSRLKGRQLSSWANPERYISQGLSAYQDEVISLVDVPLETSPSALSEYTHRAIQPLSEIFDGFTLSKGITEDLTRRLIERRL